MNKRYHVTFLPDNISTDVPPGTTILMAAEKMRIPLNIPCGGNGICGKCQVKIHHGDVEGRQLADETWLACQTKISSDVTIEILKHPKSLKEKILERGMQRPLERNPMVRKFFIEMSEPTLEDQRADLERIRDAVQAVYPHQIAFSSALLPIIPVLLRENAFQITVVIIENLVITLEPGDTTVQLYGIAFDIGTTTVAGLLVNLLSGEIMASASRTNPQNQHGDDVVSRIDFSRSNHGLTRLGQEIRDALNDIIAELVRKTGISERHIYEATIAGNTTMMHFFHQVPCEYIAQAPYVPAFQSAQNRKVSSVGLKMNPAGNIYTIPNIAGFVGADTAAAILASGMHMSDERQLLVDIGTNGEIALGNRERIVVCSTAAGPAFEGARLSCGMRGTSGAIEKVTINEEIMLSVIGNQTAQGICGSGVIDLLAELLKNSAIDQTGRLLDAEELPAEGPVCLKQRIQSTENGNQFILQPETAIYFSQRDIREVQLAKAAIFAGIQVLLSAFSFKEQDLDAILLAGAFGNYIRSRQAQVMGLLPKINPEKIKFIGNAAIEGAVRVLLSQSERKMLEQMISQIEYIELSTRLDFQEHYMLAMMFEAARS